MFSMPLRLSHGLLVLCLGALVYPLNVSGAIFPSERHPKLAEHALTEWAKIIESSPALRRVVPAAALRRPPIASATIKQIIKSAEIAGMARWCDIAENEIDRLKRSVQRYGVGEMKQSYAIALLAFVRSSARNQLSKDPCNDVTRAKLRAWFRHNVTSHINLSASAPNALTRADDRIPAELVGVWAVDGSSFSNGHVSSGQALYVGSDGLGWQQLSVNGSGRRVLLRSESNGKELSARQTEGTIVVSRNKMTVHRANGELTIIDASGTVFRRVHPTFSSQVRVALGVEPSRSQVRRFFKTEDGINAFYRTYWHYGGNKAFAVSAGGSFGYSGARMLSAQAAIDQAIGYCNQYRAANAPPCRILSINNSILLPVQRKGVSSI